MHGTAITTLQVRTHAPPFSAPLFWSVHNPGREQGDPNGYLSAFGDLASITKSKN